MHSFKRPLNFTNDEDEQLDSFLGVLKKIKKGLKKPGENIQANYQNLARDDGELASNQQVRARESETQYYLLMKMRQILAAKEDLITHICEHNEDRELGQL